MGLDMYLSKKYYVQNWEHNPLNLKKSTRIPTRIPGVFTGTSKYEITITRGGKPLEIKDITYITSQVMYWRKANAIHQWFVTNVQDGKDDCGDYGVSIEQLQELVNVIKQIIAPKDVKVEVMDRLTGSSRAARLLPTTEGFFFGDTGYDDGYFRDLEETAEKLGEAIEEAKKENAAGISVDFEYHSSW